MYKVLVPVEDDFYGHLLADYIVKHKWADGTVFKVLHVFPVPPTAEIPPSYREFREIHQEATWKLLENIAGKIRNGVANATAEESVLEGYAREGIIEVARQWGAELIVMGSHGRAGVDFEQFPIGGVAAAVTRSAPCSVLIVRAQPGSEKKSVMAVQHVSGRHKH